MAISYPNNNMQSFKNYMKIVLKKTSRQFLDREIIFKDGQDFVIDY